jgi:4-hydroxyphenylpyruvate dioxygenase
LAYLFLLQINSSKEGEKVSEKEFPKIIGVDHMELCVKDLEATSQMFQNMGFDEFTPENTPSPDNGDDYGDRRYLVQGNARFLLSTGSKKGDEFVNVHGDGYRVVCFSVDDANKAYDILINNGAESIREPWSVETSDGKFEFAEVKAYGDVVNRVVSRSGTPGFAPGFENAPLYNDGRFGIAVNDHITNNVAKGDMQPMIDHYVNVWGWKEIRFFHITTGKTGLLSKVVRSPNGSVTMPFNEPTEDASQIQEFLNSYNGPGVQHVALLTKSIMPTFDAWDKGDFEFLTVPDTYYEEVPKRVPNITEDINDLKSRGLLADGDEQGYLLQIFTQNLIGPFFFELIQRKNHDGFGEGNFKALFEAIERDQEKRGVL